MRLKSIFWRHFSGHHTGLGYNRAHNTKNKHRKNRLEKNVCKAEKAMVEMFLVCSNIVWCSTCVCVCVCVNIIYISSFLAVFLTVFVTRPQQRWSQGEGWPQLPTGVTGSQEQQESPPPPGSQSKPYIPYFMLYTWHASLWCARQTARREVGRGSLASTGGTLWARPTHWPTWERLAWWEECFCGQNLGTEEGWGCSYA